MLNIIKSVFITFSLYILYSGFIDLWAYYKIKSYKLSKDITCHNVISSKYLLSTINNVSGIVENIQDRHKWNTIFYRSKIDIYLSPGIYTYLHRNYVNLEEKLSLCKKFYTLHSWFIQFKSGTKLKIYTDNYVIMSCNIYLFSILSIYIQWCGYYNNDKIVWLKSKVIYPWGTIIQKNYTKIPWKIINKYDNIYIFNIDDEKYLAFYK